MSFTNWDRESKKRTKAGNKSSLPETFPQTFFLSPLWHTKDLSRSKGFEKRLENEKNEMRDTLQRKDEESRIKNMLKRKTSRRVDVHKPRKEFEEIRAHERQTVIEDWSWTRKLWKNSFQRTQRGCLCYSIKDSIWGQFDFVQIQWRRYTEWI
jgi:hypothetical protein